MTQPRLIAQVKVTNGGGTFDSLAPAKPGAETIRIAASVDKTLEQTPNKATIRVWNLDDKTIDKIQGVVRKRVEWTIEEREALRLAGASDAPITTVYDNAGIAAVELAWGYEQAAPGLPLPPLSVGFIGGSIRMDIEDDGEDSVLVMQCEDAGAILTAARLNKSYASGTDTITIVVDLINAMGLVVDEANLRNLMQSALIRRGIPIGKLQQIGGYNASGVPAAVQVRNIMKSQGLRWSVQDGRFLLLDRESVLPGYAPIELSAEKETLWNNPRRQQSQDMSAVTWATPEIRPGRQVRVIAQDLDAQFRVDRVKHTIDTENGGRSVPMLAKLQTIAGVF